MTVDTRRYERVVELFHAASALAPGDVETYLDRSCAGDSELRGEVASLLAHDAEGAASPGGTARLGPVQAALASMDSGAEGPRDMPWTVAQRVPEAIGRRFGDFEIVREIGRGGMGVVFEARQESLGRRVALKLLPPALGASPAAAARFEREARAAARLAHPNIVPVHAIGEAEGYHFFAMEYIDGEPLSRVLDDLRHGISGKLAEPVSAGPGERSPAGPTAARGAPPASKRRFDSIARLAAEVADALHHAHEHGVIHRDIKPGNLLLSKEGHLLVADFGLARIAEEPGMTMSGTFQGTVGYMSPEQIAAGRMKLDHRTDIYSLGAVLYEMLTLAPPFRGASREETVSAILTTDPAPLRKFDRRIPRDLETICLHALEKNPARRYATAGQMADDLRQHLAGGLISARRAGAARRAGRWMRRRPVLARLGMGAAIAVVAVAIAVPFVAERERRESEERRIREQEQWEQRRWRILGIQQKLDAGEKPPFDERVDSSAPPEAVLVWARSVLAREDPKHLRGRTSVSLQGHLRMAAQREPHGWAARLVLAEVLRAQDPPRTEEALQEQAAASQRMPPTAEAWYLRSLTTPDPELALRYTREALKGVGNSDVLRLARKRAVDLCLVTERFQEALERVQDLVAGEGESSDRMLLLGRVQALNLRYAESVSALSRAIELDPSNEIAYLTRAGVRLFQRDLEGSIDDYSYVIDERARAGSNSGWTRFHRATPYWMVGSLEKAADDYRALIEFGDVGSFASPRLYLVLEDEARSLEQAGQPIAARLKREEAQRVLADARGATPSRPELPSVLSCLARTISPGELARLAHSRNPERRCEAYYYAGEISLLQGDAIAARRWFTASVGTGVVFQNKGWLSGGTDVMNEYHLARWRLEQLSRNRASP